MFDVRCDDGEEQEERRTDCSLFGFVADEGKQVLSNSDAAAACVHAFQEAMLLVFTCVHLLVFTCLCSRFPRGHARQHHLQGIGRVIVLTS